MSKYLTPERFLVVAFIAALVAPPLSQAWLERRRDEPIQALEVFRRPPTAENLRAYEHGIEDASWLANSVRPYLQYAQFAWLRDGGEKALIGRDGWLFYRPGYDYLVNRVPAERDTVEATDAAAAIIRFRDELAVRGIKLLVVPAPNKESVYPDKVTARLSGVRGVIAPQTQALFAALAAAGVDTVNLFERYADARRTDVRSASASAAENAPFYLVQDSHWSPRGVRLAAEAVAAKLIEAGCTERGAASFSEREVVVSRLGDVARMLQSPVLDASLEPEQAACQQVVDADGKAYEDAAASDVLVLGDSFLRIYHQDEPGGAGFTAHLARALRKPVSAIINDGGASTLVRQELSRRRQLLDGKRVVVWEFVERDVRFGAEGWQDVPLPNTNEATRRSK